MARYYDVTLHKQMNHNGDSLLKTVYRIVPTAPMDTVWNHHVLLRQTAVRPWHFSCIHSLCVGCLPFSALHCRCAPTSSIRSHSAPGHCDPLRLQVPCFGNGGAGNGLAVRMWQGVVGSGSTIRRTFAAIFYRGTVYGIVPTAPFTMSGTFVVCFDRLTHACGTSPPNVVEDHDVPMLFSRWRRCTITFQLKWHLLNHPAAGSPRVSIKIRTAERICSSNLLRSSGPRGRRSFATRRAVFAVALLMTKIGSEGVTPRSL